MPGSAIVIDSGTLADGTPFELVTKRTTAESWARAAGLRDVSNFPDGICFQVDWPADARRGGGGMCTETNGSEAKGNPPLESGGLVQPPRAGRDAPGLFIGILGDPAIDTVRVESRDQDGPSTSIPVKLITLSGSLLERVGGTVPVTIFVSSLDEGEVEAGKLGHRRHQGDCAQ